MEKFTTQMLVDLENSKNQTVTSIGRIFEHFGRLGKMFNNYDKAPSYSTRSSLKNSTLPPKSLKVASTIDVNDTSLQNSANLEDELTMVCALDDPAHESRDHYSRDNYMMSHVPRCGDTVLVPPTSPHHARASWVKGVVVDIHYDPMGNEYRVNRLTTPGSTTWSTPHELAPMNSSPPPTIPVGSRVLAQYPGVTEVESCSYLSPCTVLEGPVLANKHRYLVIFDDWVVKYTETPSGSDFYDLKLKPVLSCLQALASNPPGITQIRGGAIDSIKTNVKLFLQSYLDNYPERALVHLKVGQVLNIRCDNGWVPARVEQIDASMAQLKPLHDTSLTAYGIIGDDGWLYRGSHRLEPLYKELRHARRAACQKTQHRPRHSHARPQIRGTAQPYVQYDFSISSNNHLSQQTIDTNQRAIKDGGSRNLRSPIECLDLSDDASPTGLVSGVDVARSFECQASTCKPFLMAGEARAATMYWNVNYYSDLARPILCGWERCLTAFPKATKTQDSTCYYISPCKMHPGTRIGDASTIVAYLKVTQSILAVDYFCFDSRVNISLTPLSSFPWYVSESPAHSHLVFGDISDGLERFPLPCVNELYGDVSLPDPFIYDTCRLAAPGVNLSLDPGFLTCCDCADGLCSDPTQCACQCLTASSIKAQDLEDGGTPYGYAHKRLPQQLVTGIYECNDKCPCDKARCINRVAQRGFGGARLQVYKDRHKGWCVRTLDDIPAGAFVSIYSGYILKEEMCEAFGIAVNGADQYFAEIDFIECAENGDDDDESSCQNEEGDESSNPSQWSADETEPPDSYNKPQTRKKETGSTNQPHMTTSNLNDNIFVALQRSTVELNSAPEEPPLPGRNNMTRHFCSDQTEMFILDAKYRGNVGRFYSHSCDANMFVQNVFVDSHNLCFPWIAFFTSRYVSANTELTWDYMYEINSTDKMIICKCLSSNCRGRLL